MYCRYPNLSKFVMCLTNVRMNGWFPNTGPSPVVTRCLGFQLAGFTAIFEPGHCMYNSNYDFGCHISETHSAYLLYTTPWISDPGLFSISGRPRDYGARRDRWLSGGEPHPASTRPWAAGGGAGAFADFRPAQEPAAGDGRQAQE